MGYPFIILYSDDPFQSAFHLCMLSKQPPRGRESLIIRRLQEVLYGVRWPQRLELRFIGALALVSRAVSDWREQTVLGHPSSETDFLFCP